MAKATTPLGRLGSGLGQTDEKHPRIELLAAFHVIDDENV